MKKADFDAQNNPIPPHLGGAPKSFVGWVSAVGFWLFTNILYGFAIIVAVVALWLKASYPLDSGMTSAIMKTVSLSVLAWATALMLASADIPKLFRYFPLIGGIKAGLLIATLLIFCISVIFVYQDPPDWSLYLANPDANDKLLKGSQWISVVCVIIGGAWFVVHKVSMEREMMLRDTGYHDDYEKTMDELSRKARTRSEAGGLKLK